MLVVGGESMFGGFAAGCWLHVPLAGATGIFSVTALSPLESNTFAITTFCSTCPPSTHCTVVAMMPVKSWSTVFEEVSMI